MAAGTHTEADLGNQAELGNQADLYNQAGAADQAAAAGQAELGNLAGVDSQVGADLGNQVEAGETGAVCRVGGLLQLQKCIMKVKFLVKYTNCVWHNKMQLFAKFYRILRKGSEPP